MLYSHVILPVKTRTAAVQNPARIINRNRSRGHFAHFDRSLLPSSPLFASQFVFVPPPPGRCVCGTRCNRQPHSFNSPLRRIPGVRTEICPCKRMRTRHHRGGLTTFRSVVRIPTSTRRVNGSLYSQSFHSDGSAATCTPSILANHSRSPPLAHTEILRLVCCPPANKLHPNVLRVHIAHCVPRSRSWTSLVPRGRHG